MKSILGVILVGLFIFSHAEVCNAECAWVLWKRYERVEFGRHVEWELIGAVPQYEACLKLQKKVLEGDKESYKRNLNKNVDIYDGMITIKLEKGLWMLSYECFPDTVDPRK
jgi:hypothetical protein